MNNKVVIITGGTRGIGLGIAREFLMADYNVIINYHTNETAAKLALSELKTNKVQAIKADISTEDGRSSLLKQTLDIFGKVDTLVNNAAVASRLSFLKTNEQEFDRVFNINLKAPIFMTKLVVEQMIKQKTGGSIINISSVAGHRPFGIVYSDSKAALLMATKNMAAKCAKYAIRVNSITPGTTKTDLNRRLWQDNPDEWDEHIKNSIPLGKAAKTSDIGKAAVFLASDAAAQICGSDLVIDGGYLSKRL